MAKKKSKKPAPVKKKKKELTQKQLKQLFDDSLLLELKKANKKKRKKSAAAREKKELAAIKRDMSRLKEQLGIPDKEEKPKKKKVGKKLARRNEISKLTSAHIKRELIDLRVYKVVPVVNKLAQQPAPAPEAEESAKGKFQQIVNNIYENTTDLPIKVVRESFVNIFKDYSGLKRLETRKLPDYIYFFDYNQSGSGGYNDEEHRGGFGSPQFIGMKIKITCEIPDPDGTKPYTTESDPRLHPNIKGDKDFTATELIDWFGTAEAFRACRKYDKAKGSPPPEFGLQKRIGDEWCHYHLTVHEDFGLRHEVVTEEKQLPGKPAEISEERKAEISELQNEIDTYTSALAYLTDEAEKNAILLHIEGLKIKQKQLELKPEKKAASEEVKLAEIAVEKIKAENEKIKLENDAKAIELKTAELRLEDRKLSAKEKHEQNVIYLLEKGLTYEQIKELLG